MSACGALGDIFRSGPLSLPTGDPSGSSDKGKDEGEQMEEDVLTSSELTQLDLVKCLSNMLKTTKEIKVKKNMCLTRLCVCVCVCVCVFVLG